MIVPATQVSGPGHAQAPRSLLRADPGFTKLHLLDTQIRMEEEASALLDRKASRLKLAVGLLAVGILLSAAGMLVTGGNP